MKKKLVGAHDKDILKKYKILYETSSEALMTLELPEGGFRNPNAAAVKMFKTKTKEKFSKLHPWNLSPKFQPDGELSTFKAERMINTALKKGSHFFEWTHKRYRGEPFPATVLLTKMQINGDTIIQATVRDMTEYKKLYVEIETLKKTQEALQVKNTVFDNAYVANSISDSKGVLTDANPFFLNMWGFTSKKEILGRKISDFFKDKKENSKVLEALRKVGRWEGDFVAKRKNGSTFVAYGRAIALKSENGKVIGYHSSVYDVTERRKASEQFKNAIENSPRGIHIYELRNKKDLILVSANQMADKILNIKHSERFGQTIETAFIGYKDDQRVPNIFRKLVLSGKVWHEEMPYNAGGIAGYFDVLAYRISENTLGVTFADISDRKQLEQELLLSKANDEAIIQSIGDGLYVTDHQGYIVLVNKAFEEMLGFRSREVIGKQVNEVISRHDSKGNEIPLTKSALKDVLLGKKVKTNSATVYYTKKDGIRFPVASVISPIEVENDVIGAVEVFKDITHEKEIDKAKTEFILLASHQLRTPLSIINWYTNLLGSDKKLSESSLEYVSTISQSNKRMVELINMLLNVSQMELGTYVPNKESIDIPSFITTLISELKPRIEEKKQTISVIEDKKIPPFVFDPRLLRIIVENLLTNAITYTPPEGQILVEYRYSKEKSYFGEKEIPANSISFSVQDTGYGIPRSQQKYIFQKLFRADNTKNLNTSGTGLGLYLVKSIITSAKGSIWFVSEENKGTVFFVTIPLS